MTGASTEVPRATLRREVSVIGAAGTIVGFVIGASIFILPGPVAGTVGPGLPFAYVLAVVPVTFTCLYLVQLGSVLPVTGSNYVVATRFGTPLAGYSVVWMFIACAIFALPVMALGFASYFQTLMPQANVTLTAIAIVVILALVNLMGIGTVTRIQTVMTLLFIVAIVAYVAGGIPNISVANFENPFPNGFTGLMIGAVTVYFSFTGFTVIAEIAGEVKNARKTIPIAIIAAITIILAVYVAVGAVVTGTLNWQQAAESPAAVAQSASTFYPDQVVGLISIGALFASATTINALFTAISRDMKRLGEDKIFPPIFAKVSLRTGVPYAGVLAIAALAIPVLIINLDIEQYSILTVYAFLLMQCIAAVSVFRIRKLRPDLWEKSPIQYSKSFSRFTVFGLIFTSITIFLFAGLDDPTTIVAFLVVLLVGYAVWAVRSSILKRSGQDLKEITSTFGSNLTDELNAK